MVDGAPAQSYRKVRAPSALVNGRWSFLRGCHDRARSAVAGGLFVLAAIILFVVRPHHWPDPCVPDGLCAAPQLRRGSSWGPGAWPDSRWHVTRIGFGRDPGTAHRGGPLGPPLPGPHPGTRWPPSAPSGGRQVRRSRWAARTARRWIPWRCSTTILNFASSWPKAPDHDQRQQLATTMEILRRRGEWTRAGTWWPSSSLRRPGARPARGSSTPVYDERPANWWEPERRRDRGGRRLAGGRRRKNLGSADPPPRRAAGQGHCRSIGGPTGPGQAGALGTLEE
jgi:hypothetical protein